MIILKGRLPGQKTTQLGKCAFGTSNSVRCSISVIIVFLHCICFSDWSAFALIEKAVCHTWIFQWSVTFQFYHETKWQEFSRFAVVCLQW